MTLHHAALRRPGLLLAAITAAAALLAALTSGDLTMQAVRAIAVVAFLALVAIAVRRRNPAAGRAEPEALAILARAPIGSDTGVAIVTAAGRRFLVGYGRGGVSRLAEVRIDGAGDRP